MDSDLKLSALGQPFHLGMLYDARGARIIPGITLWDSETLERNTHTEDKWESKGKISTSDSLEEKTSLLDVGASLKASFLGGLVEVGGSAKYLTDKKKFKNQKRLIVQYKATTSCKYLAVNHLKVDNMQMVDDDSATHVVTRVYYGANAFFVFDTDRVESDSIQDIKVTMEAVMKKIPVVSLEGSASVALSDKEKSLTNNLSCKFYGDFILENNPSTFEEALETYQKLSNQLRGTEAKSVPIKVWLTPLAKLDSNAAELKKEISPGLVRKAESAIEDVREMEMRCNDCLEEKAVANFSQLKNKLTTFKTLCNDYTGKLKQVMREKFPSIREGKEDESSVAKLFDNRDKSLFSHDNLDKWMSNKEREVNIIKSCVGIMEDATIVQNKSELEEKALGPGVDQALCFTFTSLESPEPFLEELATMLHSHDSQSTGNVTPATADQWYSSNQITASMREKAKTFQGLAKALKDSKVCFLIAAIENDKYKGASIYHYVGGTLVTDDFSQPALPAVETIQDRRALIWYACHLSLDLNTINGYLNLSDGDKRATCGDWQYRQDHPDRFASRTQVLCNEGLTGRCYWEVEWSASSINYNNDVGVGVAYKGIDRKGNDYYSGLGSNDISWFFGQTFALEAWHNGKVWTGFSGPGSCRRVGVYLDWPAGTLSFYRVSPNINKVTHLYTFRTTFNEAVYPGLYVHQTSNYVALCPLV